MSDQSRDYMAEALRPSLQHQNRRDRILDAWAKYWPIFVILAICVLIAFLWTRQDPQRDPMAGFENSDTLRAVSR